MNYLAHKQASRYRRAKRVRSTASGTSERPRLSVHISNLNVTAQIIDDSSDKTLSFVTTVGQKMEGSLSDKASWAGAEIGRKAKKAGVKKVVFDRGHRKYHGRIKKLAEAARAEGLEF